MVPSHNHSKDSAAAENFIQQKLIKLEEEKKTLQQAVDERDTKIAALQLEVERLSSLVQARTVARERASSMVSSSCGDVEQSNTKRRRSTDIVNLVLGIPNF